MIIESCHCYPSPGSFQTVNPTYSILDCVLWNYVTAKLPTGTSTYAPMFIRFRFFPTAGVLVFFFFFCFGLVWWELLRRMRQYFRFIPGEGVVCELNCRCRCLEWHLIKVKILIYLCRSCLGCHSLLTCEKEIIITCFRAILHIIFNWKQIELFNHDKCESWGTSLGYRCPFDPWD